MLRWINPGARTLTVVRASGWSLVARACGALNMIVATPFVMKALSPAEFGVWATLVSVITLAGFLDFGIGNGAMNLVADAHGRDSPSDVRRVLREASAVLRHIGFAVAALACAALWLPWWQVLRLPVAAAFNATVAVAVVMGAVALAVPFSLGTRAMLGLGRGETVFRWQAAGQILSLGAIVVASVVRMTLPWMVAASLMANVLPAAANWLTLHYDPQHGVASEPSATRDPALRRRILHDGAWFFALQLAGALAFTIDLPLITALRGPVEAGQYAVVQRLFSTISIGLALIWTPLWPVYRHAIAAGDNRWVRRTVRMAIAAGAGAAAIGGCAFALGMPFITRLWLGSVSAVPMTLLLGFATWSVCEAAGQALATFLNAAGIVRFQVATCVALAIAAVCLKSAGLIEWGYAIVPWATVVAYVSTTLLPTALQFRRLSDKALEQHRPQPAADGQTIAS